jgi:hypothetical protein
MPAKTLLAKIGSTLRAHPTVKPVALVADAIKDCTKRDDIVLDPFCGAPLELIKYSIALDLRAATISTCRRLM